MTMAMPQFNTNSNSLKNFHILQGMLLVRQKSDIRTDEIKIGIVIWNEIEISSLFLPDL